MVLRLFRHSPLLASSAFQTDTGSNFCEKFRFYKRMSLWPKILLGLLKRSPVSDCSAMGSSCARLAATVLPVPSGSHGMMQRGANFPTGFRVFGSQIHVFCLITGPRVLFDQICTRLRGSAPTASYPSTTCEYRGAQLLWNLTASWACSAQWDTTAACREPLYSHTVQPAEALPAEQLRKEG